MANLVKFFRLGKEAPVDVSVYNGCKQGDASNGGIIFANVKDPDNPSKTLQYIWANGIEYNVGRGSSNVHIDVSTIAPEDAGLNPSHGDFYVKEEKLSEDPTVDPRRTAYIYNGNTEKWQALDGNVNAENVYFPEGFLRTSGWGTQTERAEVKTDEAIIGKNLKEVFEYYLVEEKFPEFTTVKGSGSFSNYSMAVNGLPKTGNNFKDYVKVNGSAISNNQLVEIGAELQVQQISGSLTCTTSGTASTKESSPASKISGMSFGYCTALGEPTEDGHYMPSGTISKDTSIQANTGIATATYTIKDENVGIAVNGTLSIKNKSVTSTDTNNYSFDSSTVLVDENTNTVTLSLTHDASITCTYTNREIPGIDSVYVISNKGHVASNITASVSAGLIGTASGSVNKYTTSSVSVIGVYPIFTNGKVVGEHANQDEFDWYQNTYSTNPNNKLNLVNYLSANQTYIITFGATNATNQYKCYMFIPKGMSFNVPYQADLDGSGNIYDWPENTSRNKTWIKENTITINVQGKSVEYDVYTENSTSGAWAFKVQINKK